MRGVLPAHGPPGSSLRQWPATDSAKLPSGPAVAVSQGKAGIHKINSAVAWSQMASSADASSTIEPFARLFSEPGGLDEPASCRERATTEGRQVRTLAFWESRSGVARR